MFLQKSTTVAFIYLFLSVVMISDLYAKESLVESTPELRIDLGLILGTGSEKFDFGTTSSGDNFGISGGGGIGVYLNFGSHLDSNFDIEATMGYQKSDFRPAISNGDGEFTRTYLLTSVKYRIPFSEDKQIKIGCGIGYYFSGSMETDTTQMTNGKELSISYDNSIGMHFTFEYEFFFTRSESITLGLKYYDVRYKANSVYVKGALNPLTGLNNDLRNLDGSGIDFVVTYNFFL